MQTHHINTLMLGVLSSAYYITYALMQLPVGIAIDYFGPKKLLVFATFTCIIGSFLFSSLHSFTYAYIGRILVGFGSAFAFVGVLRIAILWLPANQFAIAAGFITTLGMLGGITGDVSLSYLAQHYGWHMTIMLSALVGVPIFIALICIPHKRIEKPKQQMRQTIKSVLLGLWQVFKMPMLWLNAIAGCLLYIPLSAFAELWGISYLQAVYNLDKISAGSSIAWLLLGWAIGAPIVGIIAGRTQQYFKVLILGSLFALIASLLLLNIHFSSISYLNFALFIFGVFCTGQILIMVIVKQLVPIRMIATAMAFTNMLIMLGGLVFQTLVGDLINHMSQALMTNQLTSVEVSYYTHVMYLIPCAISVALFILGIFFFRDKSIVFVR